MSAKNETKSGIGMKMLVVLVVAAAVAAAAEAAAQEATAEMVSAGDAVAGEADFVGRCTGCHAIKNGDEFIVLGGSGGPNLYGVIGRTAGTDDSFPYYGKAMIAAGEAGLVWDEANLAEFIFDPTAFLRSYLDDSSARAIMNYKHRFAPENVSAYLASLSAE